MRILGGLFVLLATSGLATAATFSEVEIYHGICDVSGAIALAEGDVDAGFIVLNDEDNILRLYPKGAFDPDMQRSPDISTSLGVAAGKEADLEATARIGSNVYILSSHGRNGDGKRQKRREVFVVMPIDGSGDQATLGGAHKTSLIKQLASIPTLMPSIKPDEDENSDLAPENGGLNIEGMAAGLDGKSLLIGLRNPSSNGEAIVIPLRNPSAFSNADSPAEPELGPIQSLKLQFDGASGELGIRSLEYSAATKSYVIVAGPHGDEGNFALFTWKGGEDDPVPIEGAAPLPEAVASFRPEGMLIDQSGKRLRLFSDDGGLKDSAGVECKKQDVGKRQFRSVVVTLP